MIKKDIFSLITIVFIIFALVGCNNKKSNSISSADSVASNIVNVKATPANTYTTAIENKSVSKDANNEAESNQITDEFTNESNNKETEADNRKEDTDKIEVTSDTQKENKKKVIVLDPGHGGKSSSEKEPNSPGSTIMKAKNVSGASGRVTKTPEHVIALKVAEMLKEQLINADYTVIMTRTSASETIGNIERAEIGNKNNADLVLRIHADSSEDSSVKGASMLVPSYEGYAKNISKVSKQYGEVIFNTLISEAGIKSRGIITRTDLTGFNWSKVPVVLIEMGFLSNSEEDKLLSSESYQKKIAGGLFKGIEKALGN